MPAPTITIHIANLWIAWDSDELSALVDKLRGLQDTELQDTELQEPELPEPETGPLDDEPDGEPTPDPVQPFKFDTSRLGKPSQKPATPHSRGWPRRVRDTDTSTDPSAEPEPTDYKPINIGTVLENWIYEFEVSGVRLAELSGISAPHISNLRRNVYPATWTVLLALAGAFRVNPYKFLSGPPEIDRKQCAVAQSEAELPLNEGRYVLNVDMD